ncbi:MAG TPA: hypothetical protein VFA60_15695 [Terriglobales bacterium]|nr:hypothetical protein [Terriglobales bacterium]
MKRKKRKPAAKKARVVKLSPESPAARDEGPRLIPLPPGRAAEHPTLQKFYDLADVALGRRGGTRKP